MIRKRPEKDTVNPPGQIVNKFLCPNAPNPCYCDGSCQRPRQTSKDYKPAHGGYPTPGRYLRDVIKRIQEEEKK